MFMSRLNSQELVNTLANNVKAFQATLQHNNTLTRPGIMNAIVQILTSVAETLEPSRLGIPSTPPPHATQLLAEAFSSRCPNFQLQLKLYVADFKESTVGYTHAPQRDIRTVCNLFRILLTSLPESSWSCLPVDELLEAVQHIHESGFDPTVTALLTQATEVVSLRDDVKQACIERQQSLQSKASQAVEEWDNSEYRQASILPQWEEVCISDPPARLRENVVHGAYKDWMHYYDVQFRLLREDFVAPLRKGICEYLDGTRGRKLQNVKVYNGVTILEPLFTKAGICYQLQFDTSQFQRCNWEHSKRLMFGSLVCLSPDEFRSAIYFATVSNRDPKHLVEGKVEVQFEEGARILPLVNAATFTMVESLAYFEASRHILRSLQTAEVDTMPFTQYLIKGKCSPVSPPQYLIDDDLDDYNMNCLYSSSSDRQMQLSSKLEFNILDITQWPTPDEVELDRSQLEAIQMALTQEVAVVQGPPGTGKTYIGLKIVEALLQNRHIWDKQRESPIFVMCLTNHALDQFLEGIMKQPGLHVPDPESDPESDSESSEEECPRGKAKARIVRIGGRSQSEIIQKFNIERRRRTVYVPGDPFRKMRQLEDMVRNPDEVCLEWHNLRAQLSRRFTSLTFLHQLEDYIDPYHLYQLLRHTATSIKEGNMCLEVWLGLYEVVGSQEPPPAMRTDDDLESAVPQQLLQKQHDPDESPSVATEVKNVAITNEPTSSPTPSTNDPTPFAEADENAVSQAADSNDEVSSQSSEEEELVDIQGEVSIEETARMLDYDREEFRSLMTYSSHQDNAPPTPKAEDYPEPYSVWQDDLNFTTADYGISEGTHANGQHPPAAFQPPRIHYRKQVNYGGILYWGLQQAPMGEEDARDVTDIHQLQLQDRWRLYNYWVSRKVEHMRDTNEKQFDEYNDLCKRYKESRQQADRFSLETADVIGMTTTGAAKYQHILHLVKPKIIIVEEAAEVLESHIVSALNAGTQHLILIGDHKQLRPKLNEYELVRRFKLDVSLFERLIVKGFPHATLQIQHRMRPQIAQLVCPHIYTTLLNHGSVLEYGDVRGVSKNLFFVQHNFPEKGDESLLSHSNSHEAEYISALCKYLLQQNYQPSQITVLVTYSGQLFKVRRQMPRKDFEGVRITTVDNFQGEENDIILLSLVRSNSDGKVGYLRENNRVCVAFSRAKVGFYCIGNFKMLRENVPIWEQIVSDVEQSGCVGEALPLHCNSHPDTKFCAQSPEDFVKNAPHGGCNRDCEFRLPCGHTCAQKCHITDPAHTDYLCKKPCVHKCPEGHPCPRPCHKECMPCKVKVNRQMPECGHLQLMDCHKRPEMVNCENPCSKKCPNEHPCPLPCYEGCERCTVHIPKLIPACGHEQKVPCHLDPILYKCKAPCEKKCGNGHSCLKRCYQQCGDCEYPVDKVIPECGHAIILPCHQAPSTDLCLQPCERTLPCGHHCGLLCGEQCSGQHCEIRITKDLACGHTKKVECYLSTNSDALVCEKPCERKLPCGHPCQNRCSDPCTEQCRKEVNKVWPCGHKLKRKCFQIQDPEKYPCQKKCEKTLPCGHHCTNKCGEKCAEECKVPLDKQYPCGHVNQTPCYATPKQFPCRQTCDATLACGHACEGPCSVCHSSRIHRPCKYGSKFTRFCGHDVSVKCVNLDDAHPGRKECGANCAHSKCAHDCTQECSPCTKPCAWKCPHYQCTMLCHEACNRPPCNQRCQHKLKCGHQCFGVCGEPCLTLCPLCPKGRKAFKKQLKQAKEIKEDCVYVQLGCQHIFTVEYLDAYVTPKPVEDAIVAPKKCPVSDCKQWISTSYRYGNAAKQCLVDVQAVRDIAEEKDDTDVLSFKLMCVQSGLSLFIQEHMERKVLSRYSPKEEIQSLQGTGFQKMGQESSFRIRGLVGGHQEWHRFKLYPPLTRTLEFLKGKKLASDSLNVQEQLVLQMLHNALQFLTVIDGSPVKSYVPNELGESIGTVHHNVATFIKFMQLVIQNGCRLTQQLVEDLTSEHHRLVLLIQHCESVVCAGEKTLTGQPSTLADYLGSIQADSSKRVSELEFNRRALDSSTLSSKILALDIPPCRKGQWYKCTRGHFYCLPPVRPGVVRQCNCPQCL